MTTILLLLQLAAGPGFEEKIMERMNAIAESYVKLVLGLGKHDSDYVDAYYGPEEWRTQAEKAGLDLSQIHASVAELRQHLTKLEMAGTPAPMRLRHHYLEKQLRSMSARIDFLAGKKLSFDQEAELLYDVRPPHYDEAHFQALLAELDGALPGKGTMSDRYNQFRSDFIIPSEKLDTVFKAAIAEARKRTAARLDLPKNESFVVEYVTDKAWSGYNWYKGKAHSLIQVNTDLPISIDRAVDLACHEGYPGHHVYNALLEQHLVRDSGWWEFSVYPLFSPQSLIAEGSANFGIEVAFPGEERLAFERDVLFPLAGLDSKRVEEYYRILKLVGKLSYAGNEAARYFLDGKWDRQRTVDWLVKYALFSPERATQRLSFVEKYRAYVINYNLGKDMVARHIASRGGSDDQPDIRWHEFGKLLSAPMLPSNLEK